MCFCRIEWPIISAAARNSLKKPFTPEQLLNDADVLTMTDHLKSEMKSASMHATTSYEHYRKLQAACLAFIILWNKRRSGEVSQAPKKMVEDMVNGIWKRPDEIQNLEVTLKAIADTMHLAFIRGK